MQYADELSDTARAIGVTTEALQEYQYVLKKSGQEEEDAARALSDFREKFGAARAELSKEAVNPFRALGLSAEDLKAFPTVEAALADVIARIGELSSTAEQAAIAEKLGLEPMLPAIQMGAAAIADLRREAHELGVVMDGELVRRAADAQDEFETLSKVIDIQLKSAIVDLAPAITMIIGLVADLARAFGDMADAWRDLDSKSTRGLQRELSKARVERDKLGIQDLMSGPARTPNAQFIQDQRTNEMGRLDVRIFDLEQRLGAREAASGTPPRTGGSSLRPPTRSGGRSGPKGLTAEEKAEGLAALELEHQLALARASGNEELATRLETQRLITAEAEKLVKFGRSEAEALAEATAYAERLAISREIAAEKKRQDAAFQKSIVDPGSSPNLSDGLPTLVIGPDGQGWSPEQKDAWARSVGDATADGLDYALNGGDIGEWILRLFYRNALQGLSNAMAQAANSADFGGGEGGGGSWWSTALKWGSKIFGGQQQGRAAGGAMGQGYSFGEHGRPEIGMFSNGYVADHEATQRMLVEAISQAGRGSGGPQRIDLHLTSVMQVPAGYTPPEGLAQLMAQNRQQTIALLAEKVGPLASAQQQQAYDLKG